MFEFDGKCLIKEIKSSRAVSADAKGTARIKINLPEVVPEVAAGLLLCKVDQAGCFFEPGTDDDGPRPIMHGIRKILGAESWDNMHTVKISSMKVVDATQLRVLELKPKVGGTFDVMLLLIVEEPTENFLEILTERCNRELNIRIKQPVADLEDEIDRVKEENAVKGAFSDQPKGKRGRPKKNG